MTALTAEQELKLYLLAHGVTIDPEAERVWSERYQGPMSLSEYASTSGICLYTANGCYINVPFVESFTQASEARFIFDGEFAVVLREKRVPVSVIPVPAYHRSSFPEGEAQHPFTSIGVTHTDRCRISPIDGCAWVCTFCDLPYERRYKKRAKHTVEAMIETLKRK